MIKKYFIIAFIFSFISFNSQAQNLSQQEIESYKSECYDLVGYLEFSLNLIGGNDLSPKEKDIIISKSFTKLFRDDKVQVEDDLVPDREAITNKDIQAYLKDIDFFFKDVSFSFKILTVDLLLDESDQTFFKIQTIRILNGKTIENDSIQNEQVRFIEVALKPNQRDLKVVSIYTTKINQLEENIKWWNSIPISWKENLGENIFLENGIEFAHILKITPKILVFETPEDSLLQGLSPTDSISNTFTSRLDSIDIKNDSLGQKLYKNIGFTLNKILRTSELDISNNSNIITLEPLSKLTDLHTLNISTTQINDLYPIRNLVNLQDLNISNTPVNNLDALIYSMSLQKLDISNTQVYSLESISNLANLKIINISNTHIDNISPLANIKELSNLDMQNNHTLNDIEAIQNLKELSSLNISNCPITDINSLSGLDNLSILFCNNTMINDLEPLAELSNLSILHCENTEITNISALNDKPKLSKIYCDNTLLDEQRAVAFMTKNPHVLVVYETKKLKKWFTSLSEDWKNIFASNVAIDLSEPSKEQLHQLTSILELDISNNMNIKSLEPISRLKNIKKLDASHTSITSLEPLYELRELDYLNISHNKIQTISPLENLYSISHINISYTDVSDINVFRNIHNLKYLNIESTSVHSLQAIFNSSSIREIQANNTSIDNFEFDEFIAKNSKCMVIYQSDDLFKWWASLDQNWKNVFSDLKNMGTEPDDTQLHALVKIRKLSIKNNRELNDLTPIEAFTQLKELKISGTQASNIDALKNLKRLESINLSKNPIENMDILSELSKLKYINIANTPISNLNWIMPISHLNYLDISGTQIKNLKPLSALFLLKTLIAFNTRISKLSDLDEMISLRSLKIYNTKISSRRVDDFRRKHPACAVDYY